MSFRGQHIERCGKCRLERSRCLCALVPTLDVKTKIVLLLHAREVARPTNTGRFVPWMIPSAAVVVRGIPFEAPAPIPDFGQRPAFLLHPSAARELRPEDAALDPVLLVPDGTWSESRRMINRDPVMLQATRIRLPPGARGRYALRKSPHPDQLSTLEAVARALAVLEGPAIETSMLAVFDALVERTLLTRGRLRDDPTLGIVAAGTPRVPPGRIRNDDSA